MKQVPRSPQPVVVSQEKKTAEPGTGNQELGKETAGWGTPTGQAGSTNGAGREKKTAEPQRGRPGGYLSPAAAAAGGAMSKGRPLADTLIVPLAANSFTTAFAHLP